MSEFTAGLCPIADADIRAERYERAERTRLDREYLGRKAEREARDQATRRAHAEASMPAPAVGTTVSFHDPILVPLQPPSEGPRLDAHGAVLAASHPVNTLSAGRLSHVLRKMRRAESAEFVRVPPLHERYAVEVGHG